MLNTGNIDTPSGVVGVPTVSVVAGTTATNGVVEFTATSNQTVLWFDNPLTDVAVTTTTGGTATITISGTAGATAGTITGSGAVYTVTVSTIPHSGTIVLTVAADAVYDTTGNGSPKSRSPTVPTSQQTPKPSS